MEAPKFKRMLEIFDPKPDFLLNSTYVMGKTLGDGNFAVVKTGLNKLVNYRFPALHFQSVALKALTIY